MFEKEQTIKAMMEFEGYTLEEARLTYASRQNLPASAFCGPDRTYPAHDAAHIRNAFVRLATFGAKLSQAVRKSIYSCIKRRAKEAGVEHDEEHYKWAADGSLRTGESVLKWFIETKVKQ